MFKVGDKVKVTKDCWGAEKGDEGVIMALPGKNGAESLAFKIAYAVEFPAWKGERLGHDCNGTVSSGNGQWVMSECLELVEKQRPGIGDRIKMVKDRCGAKKKDSINSIWVPQLQHREREYSRFLSSSTGSVNIRASSGVADYTKIFLFFIRR